MNPKPVTLVRVSGKKKGERKGDFTSVRQSTVALRFAIAK